MNAATLPVNAGTTVEPFLHLPALRTAHEQLQDRWEPEDRPLTELVTETRAFIERARATGTILDADSDRFAAQRLITYWVNRLCREGLDPPADTILEEYVESAKTVLDDSARPYLTLGEAELSSTQIPGWGRLIRECLQRLSDNGLAAIIGHTGSGRRTLVATGVLPRLREHWRFVGPVTPGQKPLTELLSAIAPGRDATAEASAVRGDPRHIGELLDAGGPAVVFVDQLEALFEAAERAEIEPFIRALLAIRNGKKHRVLLTIRSETLPQLAGFDDLSDAVDRGRVYLVFTTRELRQAIEDPALRIGLRFDAGVVDRLITDVQGDPAVIPLLQFSLLQLWENRSGDRITRASYDKLGGGRTALRRAADAAFHDLEQAGHAEVVRAVMMSMVRQELGRKPDCQVVTGADLWRLAERPTVEAVLTRLIKARLVDWKPAGGGAVLAAAAGAVQPTFQDADQFTLVHSALIESWPTFQEWLEADRDRRRRWQVLRSAAEKWRDNNYDTALLWGGAALEEKYQDLDELQQSFIDKSRLHQAYVIRVRKARKRLQFGIAGAFIALVCLFMIARSRLEAAHQRLLRIEETVKGHKIGLQTSLMSIDAGQSRDAATGPGDTNDPAGAVLWYSEALRLLDLHTRATPDVPDVLSPQDKITLEENLRVRLGIACRRLPVVRAILTPPIATSFAFRTDRDGKSDPRWAATWNNSNAAGTVYVRDLTGESEATPFTLPRPVNAVAFRRIGESESLLVAGGRANEERDPEVVAHVRLWTRHKNAGQTWLKEVDLPLGAAGLVTQVESSPDGRRAAIVVEERTGKDRKHRVFCLTATASKTGQEWSITDLSVPKDFVVNRIALRPPGGLAVAAALQNQTGNQGQVRVWDADGHPEDLNHDDRAPIRHVVYSPDGKWLLSCGGGDGEVTGSAHVWADDKSPTGPGGRPLECVGRVFHDSPVLYAAFNGSADRVADRFITCAENGKTIVSKIESPRGVPGRSIVGRDNKLLAHGSKVFGADFSPDGRHVVTASRDQKARVWDIPSGELAFSPLNHTGTVGWVGFDADGRHICATCGATSRSGREEQVGQVWELIENQMAWFVPTAGPVQFVGGNLGQGQLITVASVDELTETRLWSVPSPLKSAPVCGTAPFPGDRQVTFAAASPKGDRLVTTSGRAALLWDTSRGTLVSPRSEEHAGAVNFACFDPAGKVLITAAGDKGEMNGEVVFWDAHTGARRTAPDCASDWAFLFVTVSPNGRWAIATGGPGLGNAEPSSNDKVWAVLWPLDAEGNPGELIKLQGHHTEPVTFAAFSPNGPYVVTAGMDNRACVWELHPGGQPGFVTSLNKHTADIIQVTFGPGGRYVVTTGEDAKAIVWETLTGKVIMTLNHGSRITSTAFDPTGRFLVTAGQDGKARLWQFQAPNEDAEQAQAPSPLIAAFDHVGPVVAAVFLDGGARLQTVARLADIPAARPHNQDLAPVPPGEAPPVPVPDLPPGHAVGRQSGFWVTEWDLRPDSREPAEIRKETEIVARRTLVEMSRELRLLTLEELQERWNASTGSASAGRNDREALERMITKSDRAARRAAAADLRQTAEWHLNRGIELAEGDLEGQAQLPTELLADLYARRATQRTPEYFADGSTRWDDAIADYDRAIRAAARSADPVRANLHATVAVARLAVARIQPADADLLIARAIDDYDKARLLELRDFRIEAQLGNDYQDLAQKAAQDLVSQVYWRLAVGHYTRAIDLRAELMIPDPLLFVRRSETYVHLKKWDLVVDDCTMALKGPRTSGSFRDLYRRRAEANEKKAEPDFKAAITDYLASARDSGIVSDAVGSPADSVARALALARQHDADRIPDVLKAKGILHVRAERWAEAIAIFKEVTESPSLQRDTELWTQLAEAYFGNRAWMDAAAAFEIAIRSADAAVAPSAKGQISALWKRLAAVRFQMKEWDLADRAIDESVRHAFGNAEVARIWLYKAQSYLANPSGPGSDAIPWTKVIDAYSQALEKESNEVSQSSILTRRAQAYERAGLFKEMATDYDALFERQPRRSDFRLARDRAWAETERWADVRDDLKAYAQLTPTDRRVWLPLATAQLRLGDLSGYEETCARVLKLPTAADAHIVNRVLALAHVPGHNWDQALARMDGSFAQTPRSYPYLSTRGVVLYRAGKYEEARAQLEESRKGYTGSLGSPPGFAKEDGSPTDQLFLAMTYHQLNRPDEAKAWLAKAVEWLDKVQELKAGTRPSVWQRAEWELHRKEAEKLIGPTR